MHSIAASSSPNPRLVRATMSNGIPCSLMVVSKTTSPSLFTFFAITGYRGSTLNLYLGAVTPGSGLKSIPANLVASGEGAVSVLRVCGVTSFCIFEGGCLMKV